MKNSNCASQSHMAALASEAVATHNDKNSVDKDLIKVLINQECDEFRSDLRELVEFHLNSDFCNLSVAKSLLFEEIARINTIICCARLLQEDN